jgi:uncharacterized phage-like protein YoqJ
VKEPVRRKRRSREMTSEKDLIAEIKKTLTGLVQNNSSWRLMLGRESLSASEVIQRLDKDKKLRTVVLKHYVGLAIEIEQKAREKLESDSGSS